MCEHVGWGTTPEFRRESNVYRDMEDDGGPGWTNVSEYRRQQLYAEDVGGFDDGDEDGACCQSDRVAPVESMLEACAVVPGAWNTGRGLGVSCQFLLQKCGTQADLSLFSPLGGGPTSLYTNVSAMYNHPLMTSLASGYDVSVGVIILSWMVQRGIVVIPHSSSPKRLDENIRTVKLTAQEIEKINNMHREIGQLRLIDHVDRLWHDDAVPGKGRTFLGWTPQEIGWVDEKGTWLT